MAPGSDPQGWLREMLRTWQCVLIIGMEITNDQRELWGCICLIREEGGGGLRWTNYETKRILILHKPRINLKSWAENPTRSSISLPW